MARVTPLSERGAGVRARMAFWFTGRALGRLAGRPAHPDRMLEPLRVYAHLPGVLRGYAKLEQATAGTHRLDRRHQALAELKAATLTRCAYCIDLGSEVARRWGVTDEELLALARYQTSPVFSEVDKLVLRYAEGISRTPGGRPRRPGRATAGTLPRRPDRRADPPRRTGEPARAVQPRPGHPGRRVQPGPGLRPIHPEAGAGRSPVRRRSGRPGAGAAVMTAAPTTTPGVIAGPVPTGWSPRSWSVRA